MASNQMTTVDRVRGGSVDRAKGYIAMPGRLVRNVVAATRRFTKRVIASFLTKQVIKDIHRESLGVVSMMFALLAWVINVLLIPFATTCVITMAVVTWVTGEDFSQKALGSIEAAYPAMTGFGAFILCAVA